MASFHPVREPSMHNTVDDDILVSADADYNPYGHHSAPAPPLPPHFAADRPTTPWWVAPFVAFACISLAVTNATVLFLCYNYAKCQ